MLERLELVSDRDTAVLIEGETGVGKERVAQMIHERSRRAGGPLVAVNCAGIPAGLLEAELFGYERGAFTDAARSRLGTFLRAHGGTLFLDEIGELPLDLQPKLLRALQEREVCPLGGAPQSVDLRIVAATNRDLAADVAAGRFREDLYYRIRVFPIRVPSLRERPADIPPLVRCLIGKLCRRDAIPAKEIANQAAEALSRRPWPGNVRQLQNAVEQALIHAGDRSRLEIFDFAAEPPTAVAESSSTRPPGDQWDPETGCDLPELVHGFELRLIHQALEQSDGNKAAAAALLGLKRTTLVEKLKRLERARAAGA